MKRFALTKTILIALICFGASSVLAADGIGGQVKVPGRQLHKNGLTILAAIRAAGGFTKEASTTQIRLTPKDQKPIMINRDEIEKGKDDRKLQPGDEVFVPRR